MQPCIEWRNSTTYILSRIKNNCGQHFRSIFFKGKPYVYYKVDIVNRKLVTPLLIGLLLVLPVFGIVNTGERTRVSFEHRAQEVSFQSDGKRTQSFSWPEKPIVVWSWDDGLEVCYEHVAPLFDRYDIPATFFCPYLSVKEGTGDYNLRMKEVKEMSKNPLFEIGAHAYNKYNWTDEMDSGSMNQTVFHTEVVKAKRSLEQVLDTKVVSWAYPNGKWNKSIHKKVMQYYKISTLPETQTTGAPPFPGICRLGVGGGNGSFGKLETKVNKAIENGGGVVAPYAHGFDFSPSWTVVNLDALKNGIKYLDSLRDQGKIRLMTYKELVNTYPAITYNYPENGLVTREGNRIGVQSLPRNFTETTSLVGEYHFDGSGQTIKDYSGKGHDGVLGETDSVEDVDPTWKEGKGLYFNNPRGGGSPGEIATFPNLNFSGFTMMALVYGDGNATDSYGREYGPRGHLLHKNASFLVRELNKLWMRGTYRAQFNGTSGSVSNDDADGYQSLGNDKWTCLYVSCNGSYGEVRVDGQVRSIFEAPVGDLTDNANDIFLGNSLVTDHHSVSWGGYVRTLALYNKSHTYEEVMNNVTGSFQDPFSTILEVPHSNYYSVENVQVATEDASYRIEDLTQTYQDRRELNISVTPSGATPRLTNISLSYVETKVHGLLGEERGLSSYTSLDHSFTSEIEGRGTVLVDSTETRHVFEDHTSLSYTTPWDNNYTKFSIDGSTVDVFFSQPVIESVSSSQASYETGDPITVNFALQSDYAETASLDWKAQVKITDQEERVTYRQASTTLSLEDSLSHSFVVGTLSEGTYTAALQLIDPDTGNTLTAATIEFEVTEEVTELPWFVYVLLAVLVLAVVGTALYVFRKQIF